MIFIYKIKIKSIALLRLVNIYHEIKTIEIYCLNNYTFLKIFHFYTNILILILFK